MRFVCVADTHDKIGQDYKVPDGDVFIHAGDFTMQGLDEEVKRFDKWLATLPHKYKVVIPGNHELKMDEEFNPNYLASRALITNAVLLVNQTAVLGGYKFYGMPDTPEFYNWAFNRNQGEMEPYVNAIPKDVDVLITHGPPYGILDPGRRIVWDDLGNKKWITEPVGCRELKKHIDNVLVDPKLHVFGHIHAGYGTVRIGHIHYVNAAICTERYNPTNKPIVIDL